MMETADVEKMLYFRHRSATDKEELLSDKIWEDLNGEALFVRVDRTSSAIGRQYLYSLLRYDRVSGVSRCEEVVDSFTADKTLREEVRQLLRKLDTSDAYRVIELIDEKKVLPFGWPVGWLYVMQLLPILFLGLLSLVGTLN